MLELLERDHNLVELDAAQTNARNGHGGLVLIGGEAGIGKSALIQAFCQAQAGAARILSGACDALSTPRPLGPLVDIARKTNGDLRRLLASGAAREDVFNALLDVIAREAAPTVLIFEDIHWADEATLDLLRFLPRRLCDLPALLIATYRDDEIGPSHPLRVVLGDMATTQAIRRIVLAPLSAGAVQTLAAGSSLDPKTLHQSTRGNPFFVTEMVASGSNGIPATVRDAILARSARLSRSAGAALETAAVIGFLSEAWLLTQMLGAEAGAVDELVGAGILHADGPVFMFRHELTRDAALEAVPPHRRAVLHRRVLEALRPIATDADLLARLAHHAEMAGDREAVIEFAPAAARQAEGLTAHREAAAQYSRALRWTAEDMSIERAALLEGLAFQCYLTDRHTEAVKAWTEALAIWRQAGNALKESEMLRLLSRPLWYLGRTDQATASVLAALRVVEPLPPGPELGWVCSEYSRMLMLAAQNEEVIPWAERALVIATEVDDQGLRSHALNNLGCARLSLGDERGYEDIAQSLRVAIAGGFEEHAGRAYGNLATCALQSFQLERAERWLNEGIRYTADHDVETYRLCMLSWRPLLLVYQGHWSEATRVAESIMRVPDLSPLYPLQALTVLGRVRARRGDREADAALDAALDFALPTVEFFRRGMLRAARAEAAWLAGDHDRMAVEAAVEYQEVEASQERWLAGELALWLGKAGRLATVPDVPAPFALQIAGDWAAAAAAWEALGCPFETARALADSCDEGALRRAWMIADDLGARPLQRIVRQRMDDLGMKRQPRGERQSTREHPAHLTRRQIDVLALVAQGATNAEISDELFLSPKTVEHHVSAILGKLDVANRHDAATAATALGLTTGN